MNKKLLAAAIAGTLAAPVAIADVAVSGSIRVGVQGASDGTDTTWQIKNSGSRLRFKASEDLGNGQSAYVNYEFGVDAGKGAIQTGDRSRLTEVGIKGGWGSIAMGSVWSTQWNMVGTHIDKSQAYGGQGYQGQYRMNHAIRYKTSMGAMNLGVDVQMPSGGDDIDRTTVGLGVTSRVRVCFHTLKGRTYALRIMKKKVLLDMGGGQSGAPMDISQMVLELEVSAEPAWQHKPPMSHIPACHLSRALCLGGR